MKPAKQRKYPVPITYREEVQKNPDKHIDEDFEGYPHLNLKIKHENKYENRSNYFNSSRRTDAYIQRLQFYEGKESSGCRPG